MDYRKELLGKIMKAYDENCHKVARGMFRDLVATGLEELSSEKIGVLHYKYFGNDRNTK